MGEFGEEYGSGRRDSIRNLDLIGGVEMLEEDPASSKAKTSKNSSNFMKKTSDFMNSNTKRNGVGI